MFRKNGAQTRWPVIVNLGDHNSLIPERFRFTAS
jgi:hypothetical protein